MMNYQTRSPQRSHPCAEREMGWERLARARTRHRWTECFVYTGGGPAEDSGAGQMFMEMCLGVSLGRLVGHAMFVLSAGQIPERRFD